MLTGGPDDEFAPAVDTIKSFPLNGELNYGGDLIHLKFDEYIVLVKPTENILITPRPAINPTIESHNKTLEIIFNEPLLENTTYTINFNGAVADLTEKNDSVFQYVFSTGNYIDSLSLKGKVTDGFTNNPSSDMLVALYPFSNEIQFDSVPYKLKPTYICQTDKSGNFQLNYLKYGVYYLFAIADKNKNLLLDEGEAFAFLPSRTILVNAKNTHADLKSFLPESSVCKIEEISFTSPGKLSLTLSNEPVDFSIYTSCDLLPEQTGKKDSLVYWLAEPPVPKMKFICTLEGLSDTLKPLYKNIDISNQLKCTDNLTGGKLMPMQLFSLTFSQPLKTDLIDTSGIRIFDEDSSFIPYTFKIVNLKTIEFEFDMKGKYSLELDSAAVKSIYGNPNYQKQVFNIDRHDVSFYGSLVINTDFNSEHNLLVYLLNQKSEIVDTVEFSKQMIFEQLPPGDYQIMLVVDENKDGKWTTGSILYSRVPEKVVYFNELINVKSKWEREVDWILNKEDL